MPTKSDIKRLLSKGLTGLEAARLVLQDSVEWDTRAGGFLSETDIDRIKRSLTSPQDIAEYNKWIDVYRIVSYTVKEAHVLALEAMDELHKAIHQLEIYSREHRARAIMGLLPAIVTEKQYEELKAKQREVKLRELYNLRSVLSGLAYDLAPQALRDELEEKDYFEDWLQKSYPELYQQAIDKAIQLIQEERFSPVRLSEETIASLEALWQEEQEQRDKEKENPEASAGSNAFWSTCGTRERQLEEADYQVGRMSQSSASFIQPLEQLRDGLLSPEETERLLDYSLVLAEELYHIGSPEWLVDFIDEYQPSLDEETSARPGAKMQSSSVAIIQKPPPHDLDERGYYKDAGIEALASLSGYDYLEQHKGDFSIPDYLKKTRWLVGELLKAFLSIQAVVEALSEIIGVQLGQGLEDRYGQVQRTIELFNIYVTPRNEYIKPPHHLGQPQLSAFKIGKLKPTASSIQYYRDRMAIALGADWYKEALRSLSFEAEEGSLAEEAVQMMDDLRRRKDGQE